MNSLLFKHLVAAKQAIEQIENLVAIFSQSHGTKFLFVYNAASLPVLQNQHVSSILLSELPTADLSDYDGLFIGFGALEILRRDLVTKGPLFYPIERIFEELGCIDSLYRTIANLSTEIMRYLRSVAPELSREQRLANEAKTLKLALLVMLQQRDCCGLVAVLPVGELNRFIVRKSCHYLYMHGENDSLPLSDPLLNTEENWVIGFEELSLLCPNVNIGSPMFVDLRSVFNCLHREEELQKTRRGLAKLFYRYALENEAFLQPAWELACEYWLAQIECEDLVALFPCNDFVEFLETGKAICVYRVLGSDDCFQPNTIPPKISLRSIGLQGLPDGYGQVGFSLPGVMNLSSHLAHGKRFDLGLVLFKANRKVSLARSLWLLSRDILQKLLELSDKNVEMYKAALDACLRALQIYSLSNPWNWRQGRWGLYLQEVYQTLHQILRNFRLVYQVDLCVLLEDYYQALDLWYGSSTSQTVMEDIEAITEKLHNFQRNVQASPAKLDLLRQEIAHSRELTNICEIVLNRFSEQTVGQVEERETLFFANQNIYTILRDAADLSSQLPLISDSCKQAIRQLQIVRHERQTLYMQERDTQHLIARLDRLRADLEAIKRKLFIPAHEHRVLSFAFEQEANTITALLQDIESSAKLNVVLKNAWVDIHQPVHLTLEITNRGKAEAKAIEMILNQLGGYKLLDSSPVREITVLPPNMPEYIDYFILPERIGAELRVEYSFSDMSGQRHKDTWTSYLNVRSLDVQPFHIKVNRYQFGRPIQSVAEFYGRRSELQNILSLLKAGGKQNILLRGPRRMGKTSLLYMLKATITDKAARRFFEIPEEWDEQLDQVHPVFLSLHSHDLPSGADVSSQFFRILLEQIGLALQVEEKTLIRMEQEYCHRVVEVGAVNAALKVIGRILDMYPNQRIAVLLDEYDEVYRPGTGNLDRNLREFVSAEQRLTWIISSTLALFRESKTISSPWFNVFMIIELGRLSEEAAIELVEAPSHEQMIFWQSDAVLSLLNETGRHPAFTQLFCGRVVSYLNQVKTNYVLQETILTVADQIVDEQETANSHFEFYWQDTRGIGRLILLILDGANQPLRRDEIRYKVRQILENKLGIQPRQTVHENDDVIEWQDREFKNQIDWVEKITNAVSLNDQKQYFFTVPLFRRWLRRRQRYQNLEEDAIKKIAQEMKNDAIIH